MIRLFPSCASVLFACVTVAQPRPAFDVAAFDRVRVLRAANLYLSEPPVTITASTSPRSAGGAHDFFSEGDYWWPDPQNPSGPYVQRDGLSNPDNFTDHRRYLMRLSVQAPALAAAWVLTKDGRYAEHAARHLRAWFLDPATRMNPHLKYAQAIRGRVTGRGIGIIDTIHLVEVARAVEALEGSRALAPPELAGIKKWFANYLEWMTTHPYGLEEREAKNNHGTCWVMQAAAFARLAGDEKLLAYCRERFKKVIVPNQMAADGSFPQELRRTKPYAYSLFNLEAMAAACQILSTPEDNLWTFELRDGRGMRRALEFMVPYVRCKQSWSLKPDVMYDQHWPMRQSSLLFGGLALSRPDYVELWKRLPADSGVEEVVRNFFIRQPALWAGRGDVGEFGRLRREPHRSLRDDYEVGCRGLNLMVESAVGAGDARGARMTGGRRLHRQPRARGRGGHVPAKGGARLRRSDGARAGGLRLLTVSRGRAGVRRLGGEAGGGGRPGVRGGG